MAKKGKKLWRKAIDTQEIEDALAEQSRQERQGLAVDRVPDAELFYIDKDQDQHTAAAVSKGLPLRKRKREVKPLRCQAILSALHSARPVNPGATQRKKLRSPAAKPLKKGHLLSGRSNTGAASMSRGSNGLDLWADTRDEGAMRSPSQPKRRAERIKAVEVDTPGCSYNPDPEQHQEAVAEAVAVEMTKLYAQEMLPKSQKLVHRPPAPDELDALLVDAEPDDDEEEVANEEENTLSEPLVAKRAPEKKTQAARNKEKRRREAEEALEAKKSLKQQRRALDSLKELQVDIAKREALEAALAARRAADRAERASSQPPRLGKHKFEPANVQVLLSEEVDGCLRRLKAAPMMAKDRYKALQKRGVIEPRIPLQARQLRKRPTFQTGDRAEKITAGHHETMAIIKSSDRRKAGKV